MLFVIFFFSRLSCQEFWWQETIHYDNIVMDGRKELIPWHMLHCCWLSVFVLQFCVPFHTPKIQQVRQVLFLLVYIYKIFVQ